MENNIEAVLPEVVARVVPEHERIHFLPFRLGTKWLAFESNLYGFARKLDASYNGGYWEFIEVGQAFYLRLDEPKEAKVQLISMNGSDEVVSYDAAGITLTLFALGAVINKAYYLDENDKSLGPLVDKMDDLKDFGRKHPERSAIFRLID